ncbi:hypothetical protein G6O69_35205 [Pseudenhygromyxa sp. WMMC2535]|uniref:lanthionine synthetase LanC family protein n=1 Tax=Pseudenhygromyxa sp. WMMC2535 TaxID=2712867 RepID=UPI001595B059|nr:lanthionine synthetase LanC family protein [Pseudenhygromyxa sp. WMMC2535]NVB43125.1 hypothetical protein [Pseudenhygromyxa sp. WMMC2535]
MVELGQLAIQYLELDEIWSRGASTLYDGIANSRLGYPWLIGTLSRVGIEHATMTRFARVRLRSPSGEIKPGARAAFVGSLGRSLARATMADIDPDQGPCVESELESFVLAGGEFGPDLFLGTAGVVAGLAQLVGRYPVAGPLLDQAIDELYAQLEPGIGQAERRVLGLAHGLAGQAVALEVGHRRRPCPFIEAFRAWTYELVCASVVDDADGRPLWPHAVGGIAAFQGWCNGTPGMVHGFALAAALSGDRRYRALTERGLELMGRFDFTRESMNDTLCCGALGVAEAYLNAFRLDRDPDHLERARAIVASVDPLAMAADNHADEIASLHRGLLGWIYVGCECEAVDELPPVGLDLWPVVAAQ